MWASLQDRVRGVNAGAGLGLSATHAWCRLREAFPLCWLPRSASLLSPGGVVLQRGELEITEEKE